MAFHKKGPTRRMGRDFIRECSDRTRGADFKLKEFLYLYLYIYFFIYIYIYIRRNSQ